MKHHCSLRVFILIGILIIACGRNARNDAILSDQNIKKADSTEVRTLKAGEKEYLKYCLTCHQPDGNGVRSQFPPLASNELVKGPADSLIKIVLFGLEGPITVKGLQYNQLMPAQDYLTDQQIADVLTYIRGSWGNNAEPVVPGLVAEIRKKGK